MRTKVFVSSTCYDLYQLRRDLEDFLNSLGYEAVLSDSRTVAIPPGLDKVEACKWLVRSCDILVLVIGGRYGTTNETGKSITNIEYDTALETMMPIYCFVEKDVWNKRDVYSRLFEMVRDGDLPVEKFQEALGGIDPRVYLFIEGISQSTRDNWIWPFSTAGDIIETLKNQWSLLFREMLFQRRSQQMPVSKPMNQPEISLDWTKERAVLKDLLVPSVPNSLEDRIEHLEKLKPTTQELKIVEEHQNEIFEVIQNMDKYENVDKYTDLREEVKKVEDLLDVLKNYSNQIDEFIQQITANSEEFRWQSTLFDRGIQPEIQIHNNGTMPAVDLIIYVNPSERAFFCDVAEILQIGSQLPSFRPPDIEGIIELALNPPKKIAKLSTVGHGFSPSALMGSYGALASWEHLPSYSQGPNLKLEDRRMRIDLGRLKHRFVRSIDFGERYYLCNRLKKGESVDLQYECYADNIPSPTKGTLRVVGE